ncbi:MAG TPA: type II and III secretion system protein family protein, partial [Rhizobiaceae bacterium]|nr:type II and III secretion system protein family protein [Rhizobiaceae bacterium]
RSSQIVNMLKIIGEDQVTLKVTVAEISRTVMKQLGVNLIANATSGGITTGVIDTLLPGGAGGTPAPRIAGYSSPTGSIQAYLNALDQSGVMKTLAEPTLTAVSGEKATFRVGGEFNIVNSVSSAVSRDNQDGDRIYGIQKIEYGIGLEFQPVVLSPGRISLKVRTQVSEPTMEGGVAIGDTSIISLRKRLADTSVELPSGGSMMIAGLVRDDIRQSVNGIPGLAKVPVLGALFRSRDFVRNESELVIIVTPYLAKPTARAALARPDDNFNAASDGAGIFLGRVNRVYGNAKTDLPKGRYHGVVGYIYK